MCLPLGLHAFQAFLHGAFPGDNKIIIATGFHFKLRVLQGFAGCGGFESKRVCVIKIDKIFYRVSEMGLQGVHKVGT